MADRQPLRSRYTFFAAYGFGPYECFFCREPVPFESVWVHHIDEDQGNDHPYNLAASHPPCHNGFHHKGKRPLAGIPKSPEHRAKLSAALKGKPWSPARRAA